MPGPRPSSGKLARSGPAELLAAAMEQHGVCAGSLSATQPPTAAAWDAPHSGTSGGLARPDSGNSSPAFLILPQGWVFPFFF